MTKYLMLGEGFVKKKTDYNAKITEIDGKIPGITGLVTTAAINIVENKITDVSNLVKKTDYDAKISHIVANTLPHLIIINLLIKY